jgi:hypothetical protein
MGTDKPWEPPPERPGGVWRSRVQRLKTLRQSPWTGTVVLRIPAEFRETPLLAGLTPVRVLPEGDAEYVVPIARWREILERIREAQEKQRGEGV